MIKFMISILCLYILLTALLFIFQRSLLYFPTPNYEHNYEVLEVENDSERINIIKLNAGNERAFIYFGGNAEAVIANAQEFRLKFPTTTIYLVNYRGYGSSTGKPTEAGLFSDAVAIFDSIKADHVTVSVIGRSLGSGVAMYVAANRPVNRLALITPFDSIVAVARNQFPIFPISLLIKDKFDSISLSLKVDAPVLILAGQKDTIIPLKHSERLYQSFAEKQANMIVIEQAGHNNISLFDEYVESLSSFLNAN